MLSVVQSGQKWNTSKILCISSSSASLNLQKSQTLLLLQIFNGVVSQTRDLHPSCNTLYLSSPRLCFFIVISLDLSVDRKDSLTS